MFIGFLCVAPVLAQGVDGGVQGGIGRLGPGVEPSKVVGAPVVGAAPAPAGPFAAVTVQLDGRVARWKGAADGLASEPAGKLEGAGQAVAWSAAGPFALDDAGAVYRVDGDAPARLARHEGGALALAATATLLATGGCDGAIRLWSAKDGASRGLLEGHQGPVAGLAVAGGELWSAGWDGTVRCWDLPEEKGGTTARGKPKGKPLVLGPRELTSLAASPDGALVVVGGHDGGLHVVEAKRRRAASLPPRPHGEWVRAVAVAPDGARAVAVLGAESALLHLDPAQPARAVAVADPRVPSVAVFGHDGQLLCGRFDGSFGPVTPPGLPAPIGGKK